ncbi:MAG TPA: hypothetical protein VKU39_07160 [Streptosporangiaceae bacterium]|nr:hypothetical protein [Streptosporangiaceae bacterium]
MVTVSLLTPGDLVLFDRNCHKSMRHGALMMAGATPVYLNPTRDANGIIGPVDHRLLDESCIRDQIRRNPLVTDPDAWQRPRVVEMASRNGAAANVVESRSRPWPPDRVLTSWRATSAHWRPETAWAPLRSSSPSAARSPEC